MSVDAQNHLALRQERRVYTCPVCGTAREVTVRMIEKWVCVCLHPDSRGTVLPVMQLKDEGRLIID